MKNNREVIDLVFSFSYFHKKGRFRYYEAEELELVDKKTPKGYGDSIPDEKIDDYLADLEKQANYYRDKGYRVETIDGANYITSGDYSSLFGERMS